MTKEVDIVKTNISSLNLNDEAKLNLQSRFLYLLSKYKNYQTYYSVTFNYGRFVVTVGSILVPAILTSDNISDKYVLYWVVWAVSLLVSIINAYIHLFKLDKKYYSNIWMIENLSCEFWQYKALCGKYSGTYTQSVSTHENQFVFFCNNIERLQVRNVEQNYIKLFDNDHNETQVVKSINKEYQNNHTETTEELETLARIEIKEI